MKRCYPLVENHLRYNPSSIIDEETSKEREIIQPTVTVLKLEKNMELLRAI